MAKKDKEVAVKATEGSTAENIMEKIRSGNLMTQAITKQAEEQIKKEKDERMANDLKRVMLKADYKKNSALLQVRFDRKKANITLEKVKKAEILKDQLSGFVLTEDKIAKHGGADGKLELEVVTDYEKGTKEKQTYELKKGEEVWVPGTLTIPEYERAQNELAKKIEEEYNNATREHDRAMVELREQYPNYWSYDWRW